MSEIGIDGCDGQQQEGHNNEQIQEGSKHPEQSNNQDEIGTPTTTATTFTTKKYFWNDSLVIGTRTRCYVHPYMRVLGWGFLFRLSQHRVPLGPVSLLSESRVVCVCVSLCGGCVSQNSKTLTLNCAVEFQPSTDPVLAYQLCCALVITAKLREQVCIIVLYLIVPLLL
jgi:hypothetical protein